MSDFKDHEQLNESVDLKGEKAKDKLLFTSHFFLFLVFMLIKFALLNQFLFGQLNIKNILISQVLPVLALFLLVELLFKKKKIFPYLILDLIITFIFFSSSIYYQYYGSILNYTAVLQLKQVSAVSDSVGSLFNYKYLLFFADFIVFAIIFKFLYKSEDLLSAFSKKGKLISFLVFVVLCFVTPFIYQYNKIVNDEIKAQKMGIINYQFTVLSKSLSGDNITLKDVNNKEIAKTKGIDLNKKPEFFGATKDKDVIVVQIEAFQNFMIGKKIGNQELTPNLNKLIESSAYFPHFFQQIGKGNTSDAEFMTNTSLYPVGEFSMSQKYSDRDIPSMPKLLEQNGYDTYTFHTNDKKFWNRGPFYNAVGFNHIYDKSFFGTENSYLFGRMDKDLFKMSVDELAKEKKKGKKMYVNMITMSSHFPFQIPPQYRSLKLPSEYNGTMVGDYLQATHYADEAIGVLIDELKKNKMFDNTVLVFYGDHFGLNPYNLKGNDEKLLNNINGRAYGQYEMMNIPLIIHSPNEKGKVYENVGGQVDIMPTLANLLGVNLDNYVHFGEDLLNNQSNILPERFYLPNGSFINDKSVYVPGQSFTDGQASDIETGNKNKITNDYKDDYERAMRLTEMSDLYVNSLPKLSK